jgi:hypothetical protein
LLARGIPPFMFIRNMNGAPERGLECSLRPVKANNLRFDVSNLH